MADPAIIYDKPKPGTKTIAPHSLRMMRTLLHDEREFLRKYCEAPACTSEDTRRAKNILCSVLPLSREELGSDSDFSMALHFAMTSSTRPVRTYSSGVFRDREGGADELRLLRPLQPDESAFLAKMSVAPCYTNDEADRAKLILSEVLGIPRAELERDAVYLTAMDRVVLSS